jgi:recombinational DNA repair ATPase RecF
MQILRLEAENLKRIKVVSITPEGELVVIAGRNGQGKTSVLDSIMLALGGRSYQKDAAPDPIRHGEESARVQLDMGELIVTRKWEGDRTSLVVTNGEGAKFARPQEQLDALLGALTFDPLVFAGQQPAKQRAMLLEVVDVGIDLDATAERRAELFAHRTDLGRQGKMHEGALAKMAKPKDGLPAVRTDTAELSAEMAAFRRAEREYRDLEAQLSNAEARVTRARQELENANAAVKQISARLDALDEPRDPDDLIQMLNEAAETNAQIAQRDAYEQQQETVADYRRRYDEATAAIAALDQGLSDALAAARMPIEGLGFTDQGVTYQGVPFEQCSGAERLRVSMAVAMAQNPRLRVLRITDGSLLDSDNLALVAGMAAEHGYQVWIERVGDADGIGVVIEDGMVRDA